MMRVWFCCVRRTHVATDFDPFFVLVEAIADKCFGIDSTYKPQYLWVHLNGRPVYSVL